MKKFLAIAIASLMLAAAIPSVDAARTHGGTYIAGEGITIWCSTDNHNLIPIGTDPFAYPSPLSWLFSGEPECAVGDATNLANDALGEDREEWAYGGFAWIIHPNERTGPAAANTADETFGAGQSFLTLFAGVDTSLPGPTEDVSSEGCGPQAIIIPPNIEVHWQSTPENPLFIMWAFIPPVGVTDDLQACFASTGTVTATIG